MTRQEIIQFAQSFLDEGPNSTALDPVAYNIWVDTAANEVARATDCFYLQYETNLTQGAQSYCAPAIYKLKAVTVTWSDGSNHTIRAATPSQLDQLAAYWRADPNNSNQPTPGNPTFYVPRGLNLIWLAPVPNYSLGSGASGTATLTNGLITAISVVLPGTGYLNPPSVIITDSTGSGAAATASISNGGVVSITVVDTGVNYTNPTITFSTYGLTMEGLAVPKDGNQSLWPNMTDECPLPTRTHEAVGFKVALLRGIQSPTQVNQIRRQMLDVEYRRALGYLESEAALYSPATRSRTSARTRFHGVGFGYGWGWW